MNKGNTMDNLHGWPIDYGNSLAELNSSIAYRSNSLNHNKGHGGDELMVGLDDVGGLFQH